MGLVELLRLTNTVLEAALVILIASVLLYGIRASLRSRVARASNLLLGFAVVAYLGDLVLTQLVTPTAMERWLRAEWVGIAFVPSAYFHLSDALLGLSGDRSHWRRLAVAVAYACSAAALALAGLTDLIVRGTVVDLAAPQLRPGPLFPLFTILFGALIAFGAALQHRARARSRTATMKTRITYLIASAGGPVVSVFPYLLITGQSTVVPPALFWAIQVVGNSVVGLTVFSMTYSVAFFGVNEPDRVVRLRLIQFLARGPLVAILVLTALVAAGRAGRFLGLPAPHATPFIVVGGIVILQWMIMLVKPALERWVYLDERHEVVRLQELRDRLLSTRDLRQFLENVLAAVCELLQVETAFVASLQPDGTPRVELIVGPSNQHLLEDKGRSLRLDPGSLLETQGEHFAWNGYWVFSLHDRAGESVLGILGVCAPAAEARLEPQQEETLVQLAGQAAAALEDRLLQKQVFASMEGLLRQVDSSPRQVRYEGSLAAPDEDLLRRADFTGMVRDALSHYWGGPKLSKSPLLKLQVVRESARSHPGGTANAMRSVLLEAIESLRPEGKRSMTTAEWILYNILELKFVKRYKVRDIARRLAMSESDLYRKQRVAIEEVARAIAGMEEAAGEVNSAPAAESEVQ